MPGRCCGPVRSSASPCSCWRRVTSHRCRRSSRSKMPGTMTWQNIKERFDLYERLMRLDKPIGILLLLWPTFWALWLSSNGHPNWIVVWVFTLGTVLMRSAGCVINDYADRDFDRHVERTKERPLTSGKVTVKEALALFAGLSLASFTLVLMLGNKLVILLSLPALFLAASYPFTKRFFAIPQA